MYFILFDLKYYPYPLKKPKSKYLVFILFHQSRCFPPLLPFFFFYILIFYIGLGIICLIVFKIEGKHTFINKISNQNCEVVMTHDQLLKTQ